MKFPFYTSQQRLVVEPLPLISIQHLPPFIYCPAFEGAGWFFECLYVFSTHGGLFLAAANWSPHCSLAACLPPKFFLHSRASLVSFKRGSNSVAPLLKHSDLATGWTLRSVGAAHVLAPGPPLPAFPTLLARCFSPAGLPAEFLRSSLPFLEACALHWHDQTASFT